MDFDSFLRAACPPLDLQWRKYRRRAARHRVTARMNELGLKDFASYLSYLQDHPEESTSLADRMLVTVTRFFRDRACWERLAKEVLEPAVAAGGKPFRAWSAGCCGGEEPYTLVLLWRSLVGSRPGSRRLQVVATDIDGASLERAAEGRYTSGSLREVPDGLREKHFRKEGSFLVLDEGVISAVTLRHSNLMTDPVPEDQDLVLCRYLVFTYYRGEKRMAAARRLAASLRKGGILFTGRKEGLGVRERELFDPVAPEGGIYRKRDGL
jgi:chemotaxis methyl-accepting protein methylase